MTDFVANDFSAINSGLHKLKPIDFRCKICGVDARALVAEARRQLKVDELRDALTDLLRFLDEGSTAELQHARDYRSYQQARTILWQTEPK